MFYFIFVLCCKDTTKSNNRQIFKGKSYYIVYYLTFLNRKTKYYYLFTYYSLYYYYYILYVSYYIIYLIIYRERTKANGKGRAAPRRSAILPASSSSSSPPSGGEGREEQSSRRNRKKEDQGEGCRRHLRPSLASLLFRLLPHTVRTIASRSPLTSSYQQPGARGRAATPSGSGRCHRHTLPPPRHRSTATSSDRAAPRAVGHPARLGPVLFPLSGGEGMAASQPGRAIPSSSPRRPSPPCRGVPGHIGGHLRRGAEIRQAYQCGGCHSVRIKVPRITDTMGLL